MQSPFLNFDIYMRFTKFKRTYQDLSKFVIAQLYIEDNVYAACVNTMNPQWLLKLHEQ